MRLLRMLSLCSGIGAIDYVWSHILGQIIAGQVEIDSYCRAVLAKQFPNVKRLADIKGVKGDEFGAIDVLVAGVPCQSFSKAGKQRGTADDRFLWPYAFAIVQVARPRWVVIENVDNFINLAFELVATDLESEGYEVGAYIFPACALGAPHRRQRCFIVAHAASTRWEIGPAAAGLYDGSLPSGAGALADSNGELAQRRQRFWDITLDGGTDVAYIQSNTEGWGRVGEESSFTGSVYSGEDGAYNVAGQAQPGLGRVFDGVAGWLDRHRWPSLPGEEQEEWEPPRTITHKVAHRARRLKALGNAVVPQQIYPILKYIVEYESGGRL